MKLEEILAQHRRQDLLATYPKAADHFAALDPRQQVATTALLRDRLAADNLVGIEKLMLALRYLNEGRVELVDDAAPAGGSDRCHKVTGDHDTRHVNPEDLTCHCPLFTGSGRYTGRADVCSHLLAIFIAMAGRE